MRFFFAYGRQYLIAKNVQVVQEVHPNCGVAIPSLHLYRNGRSEVANYTSVSKVEQQQKKIVKKARVCIHT